MSGSEHELTSMTSGAGGVRTVVFHGHGDLF